VFTAAICPRYRKVSRPMKKLILAAAIITALVVAITGCANELAVTADKPQTQADDAPKQQSAPSEQPTATVGPQLTLAPPIQPIEPEDKSMYSSYAHMRSFDPTTGIAEFDYFDILTGDEAVDWLINGKGYCSVDAQDEVDAYADSEYIAKNLSPYLRAVDLTTVPLKLMYSPDGTLVSGAQALPSDYTDILALWKVNQNYVLYSHFYYITVDEETEQVLLVEQVYRP